MKLNPVTGRRKLFIEAFLGPAAQNPAEAAKIAGYKAHISVGYRLRKSLAPHIEQLAREQHEAKVMSAKGVMEGLTEIAKKKDHKDRTRALELLAKIHGLLTDKIDLTVDRKKLASELKEALGQLSLSASASSALVAAEDLVIDVPAQDISELPRTESD